MRLNLVLSGLGGQGIIFAGRLLSHMALSRGWPVIGADAKQLGSVGLFIRPEIFLAESIEPVIGGLPVDAWAMETEGACLYDPDPQEIGRNILEDPLYEPYPDLRRLARSMAKRSSGTGQYAYLRTGTQDEVSKLAHWTTVGLHGTEWRLVLVQVVSGVK